MSEQDLLRIVRNLSSSVVDLVDSSGDNKTIPAVLLNVRNSAVGFVSLLDEVIIDAEGLEDIIEDDKPSE